MMNKNCTLLIIFLISEKWQPKHEEVRRRKNKNFLADNFPQSFFIPETQGTREFILIIDLLCLDADSWV